MHAIHFPKSKGKVLHRRRKALQRAIYTFFLVLIQERTKENQGWKSPTRWVPRGWNCHAILFATPVAWLMWYRLLSPPPRSTPDPLAGQAFMPLPASSAPFSLRDKVWDEAVSHEQPRWPLNISPERGDFSPAIRSPKCFSPLLSGEGWGWGQFHEQRTTLPAP